MVDPSGGGAAASSPAAASAATAVTPAAPPAAAESAAAEIDLTGDTGDSGDSGDQGSVRTEPAVGKNRAMQLEEFRELLYINVQSTNMHLLEKGKLREPWDELDEKLYVGHHDDNGLFVNGPMSMYKHASTNGGERLRGVYTHCVEKDAKSYLDKLNDVFEVDEDIPNHLCLAFKLYTEADKKKEAATARRNAQASESNARRLQNEGNEERLGLRGASVNATPTQAHADAGRFLGGRPNATAGTTAAASAAARGRAQGSAERRTAQRATQGCTSTVYAPGELEKQDRHPDPVEKMDKFTDSLNAGMSDYSTAITDLVSAFKPAPESPNKKRRTALKELSDLISHLQEDRKKLLAANDDTEFGKGQLKDCEDQLLEAMEERRNLRSARRQL